MGNRRILVPFDFSEGAVNALERGIEIAGEAGCELRVHHVITAEGEPQDSIRDRLRQAAGQAHCSLSVGSPAEEILKIAEAEGVSLIVLGDRGSFGLRSILMGSTTRRVIEHAAIPVVVVKSPKGLPYRKALLTTDFSDASFSVIQTALACLKGAQFMLFHGYVVPPEMVLAQRGFVSDRSEAALMLMRDEMQQKIAAFRERLDTQAPIECRVRASYAPAEDILELAESWQADLIVMATGGVRTISSFFMGSTADTLLRRSRVDMMVLRA